MVSKVADDAPGWNNEKGTDFGPICWKCSGKGSVTKKRKLSVQCPVCNGKLRLAKKNQTHNATKATNKRKRPIPEGFIIPGPSPAFDENEAITELDEELCHLVGKFRVFQKIKGHRWSTDDLVTAWFAIQCVEKYLKKPESNPNLRNHIDLGCGLGSVLLMMNWKFPDLISTGVEAQKLSFDLAKRNVEFNLGSTNRVSLINQDIRNLESAANVENDSFDLVTGTPPYFKISTKEMKDGNLESTPQFGGMPTCKQSAPARYEFRGGIEEYCSAASPLLKDDAIFVVCQGVTPKQNEERVYNGCLENDLKIIDQVNVKGREDKPVLFSVYCMVKRNSIEFKGFEDLNLKLRKKEFSSDFSSDEVEAKVIDLRNRIKEISVRKKGGIRTKEYEQLLVEMGIPP